MKLPRRIGRVHQEEAAQDQPVAQHDQHHQPYRQHADRAEAQIHAGQQCLVGERVEQRPQPGAAVEILRDIAVHCVGEPGRDKDPEGGAEAALEDQPDRERHA